MHLIPSAQVDGFGSAFVQRDSPAVALFFSNLPGSTVLVGRYLEQIAVAFGRLGEQQGPVIGHPFHLFDPLRIGLVDLPDKFPFHIAHKQGTPAYEAHFFAIGRNIEGRDFPFDIKIFVFGQDVVPVDVDIDFVGFVALDVVKPELVILFKDHLSAVGVGKRSLDRGRKLGKWRFLPICQTVKIVLIVSLVRNKINIPVFIQRGAEVFALPGSVLSVFFGDRIV